MNRTILNNEFSEAGGQVKCLMMSETLQPGRQVNEHEINKTDFE
ncbi:MAG: hypothetical protein SH818_15450 [Saprospiraceae bacterium]|nr:hypothetical protein [Saprospiraceae bacterium]